MPVVMSLALPGVPMPTRHWRFNSSLLSDDEFVKYLGDHITFFLETNTTSDTSALMVWDALKAYLRGQIISFTVNKRRKSQREHSDLLSKMSGTNAQYALTPTPELYNTRLELKTKFDLLTTHQTQNILLKNKSTFYEHGEKAGKLLANQLKGRRSKQLITSINTQSGNVTLDPTEINTAFKDFYSHLYSSQFDGDDPKIKSFLDSLPIPTTPPDLSKALEAPITQAEITIAISSMQSGKSPGPDGFPSEFFKKFSTLLSPYLTTVLAESFQLGSLPPSLNEAIITLISKKGKDPTECASYRPISLLNTDAKILAKVLARRLEGVIPLIISSDQTGFIKNRYSFFNVRRLFNIIYSPTGNVPECVVALDAEKAFDRVEWRYLFTVLEKFGFGSSFISLVNLLYASPTAAVQTNGTLSQPFALGRGTRQGCPLSPILFNLAIEPLAIALRNSADVAGISRGGLGA